MQKPPFRLALPAAATSGARPSPTGPGKVVAAEALGTQRTRLAELDAHLHCSIIGTCLSTADLRRLMARFIDVLEMSDLDIHHEAVRQARLGGPVAKALHKALDQTHAQALQTYARAKDPKALACLWEDGLRAGEIPGAYWALLTHRELTPTLRQKAFGDVHMLSHLVGAAHRADLKRLCALEHETVELAAKLEREKARSEEALGERDARIAHLEAQLIQMRASLAERDAQIFSLDQSRTLRPVSEGDEPDLIALHSARRERAERLAEGAKLEAERLQAELSHLQDYVRALARELSAAEDQLRSRSASTSNENFRLAAQLAGKKILYVGGRPSSTPALRDLVERHGGEFRHHDGGLEDRKGLLAAAAATVDLVVIPIDCVDHDSATNLKRLCARSGVPFVPLRSASVASFAAALTELGKPDDREASPGFSRCIKHS